jgi:hypothetical protein
LNLEKLLAEDRWSHLLSFSEEEKKKYLYFVSIGKKTYSPHCEQGVGGSNPLAPTI